MRAIFDLACLVLGAILTYIGITKDNTACLVTGIILLVIAGCFFVYIKTHSDDSDGTGSSGGGESGGSDWLSSLID